MELVSDVVVGVRFSCINSLIMAINGHRLLTVVVFAGLGVYSGVKFFEPLVVEQLRKDGNLRSDIEIPKFDEEGNKIIKLEDDKVADNNKPL